MFPPCERIISLAIDNPNPTPDLFKLLLLSTQDKGLKTLSYSYFEIPGPSSSMKIITLPTDFLACIKTFLP